MRGLLIVSMLCLWCFGCFGQESSKNALNYGIGIGFLGSDDFKLTSGVEYTVGYSRTLNNDRFKLSPDVVFAHTEAII